MSGEIYLKYLNITAWKALSNRSALETDAPRKVLLHKKTIEYLTQKSKEG
jgi:tmRNA-binding protein